MTGRGTWLKPGQRGYYMLSAIEDGRRYFALTYSMREADRMARESHGTVHAMPLPGTRSWDAPTFRMCSEMIRDYRS